jgi:hypothetical protein
MCDDFDKFQQRERYTLNLKVRDPAQEGFALVVAVLAALPSREVPAAILFVLSGLGLVWALFFAPVWCGAVTRKHGPCHKQLLGALNGLSPARAQMAEIQNDVCQPSMATTE